MYAHFMYGIKSIYLHTVVGIKGEQSEKKRKKTAYQNLDWTKSVSPTLDSCRN